MSAQSSIILAGFFAAGFAWFALSAYFYDFLGKEIPGGENECDGFLPGLIKFHALALAPFKYLVFNIRRGNFLSIVPFAFYLVLLAAVLALGFFVVHK